VRKVNKCRRSTARAVGPVSACSGSLYARSAAGSMGRSGRERKSTRTGATVRRAAQLRRLRRISFLSWEPLPPSAFEVK
jgi:hypothetical protein